MGFSMRYGQITDSVTVPSMAEYVTEAQADAA